MASGWNKTNRQKLLSKKSIIALVTAALFHDCGYIKDKGDADGFGGKYSFNHTERSTTICSDYLKEQGYDPQIIAFVLNIIETTDFNALPDLGVYDDAEQRLIAQMVASSDLIAQMADIKYMEHLRHLYTEFAEAYTFHGKDNLIAQGVQIFETFEELLSSTTVFYKKVVLPRLDYFGRMDQYLTAYFAEGRNPYLENIIANLSAQMQAGQIKWQRLGEILQELHLVSESTINKALTKQKDQQLNASEKKHVSSVAIQDRLFQWATRSPESTYLGDILMQMNAVDPTILRRGILCQLIPDDLLASLSRKELVFLLHISLLVQNTKQDPWVFNQALEMVNEALGCSRTALYLAHGENNELICTLFSGGKKPPCRIHNVDKGLSGWVYSHGRTAFLQKGMIIGHEKNSGSTKITDDIGSLLGIPLYIDGSLVGVIELSDKKIGHFSPHDADIMTVVAHILAGLLQAVSEGCTSN